jgi:hypothetical protein
VVFLRRSIDANRPLMAALDPFLENVLALLLRSNLRRRSRAGAVAAATTLPVRSGAMTRLLFAFALVAACSRSSSQPAARAPATAPTARAAAPAPAAPAVDPEAEEQREIVEAMREVSAYPDTAEGVRGFVTELTRAAAAHDRERLERLEHELVADERRFELGVTFEGARLLRGRVVPGLEARARDVQQRLGALRAPVTVTVASATGAELADGAPHGFDPAVARARAHLRTAVRYFRVDVAGADGQRVTLQPMAFLAARWTWMGEFWNELPPAAPTTPAAPAGSPTAR